MPVKSIDSKLTKIDKAILSKMKHGACITYENMGGGAAYWLRHKLSSLMTRHAEKVTPSRLQRLLDFGFIELKQKNPMPWILELYEISDNSKVTSAVENA